MNNVKTRGIKNSIIALVCFFLFQSTYGQSKIYFDKDWKKTTKEEARFYRVVAKKNDSLFYIRDYFISGVLQMNGHFSNLEQEVMEGKITFYDEKGKITNSANYVNGVLNGPSIVYLKNGKIEYTSEYKNGDIYNGIYKAATVKYLYKNGVTAKRIEFLSPNDYYPLATTVYGKERDTVYWYTSKGKKIGFGTYKGTKTINGLDIKKSWLEVTHTFYKNGKKEGVQNIFYEGKLIVENTFANDVLVLNKSLNPFTGKFVTCKYKNNKPFQGHYFVYHITQDYYDEYVYDTGKITSYNKYKSINRVIKTDSPN
ncbi:hypothetical protein [Cellulophaga fucicola]|uniref:Antitoxin component YwqK of the YwqJK toxin-antitoxin module n=1 Tax=Cellulophaga fucicola TaxID=76595 RepID=A0A1K1NVE9_9FLAO|nr:hypothetical protein [Cellulophaga fucicola]SFW39257.1 Antitoxin component YwqK of the YwqJK toxin-antitoxin module [Cellulophaga fucicola]